MSAFDVGSIEARLTLDRTPFMTSLEIAEQAAREFDGQTFEANLAADTAGLFEELANANRLGEQWDGKTFQAKLGYDLSRLDTDHAAARRMGEMWEGQNFDAKLGVDISNVATGSTRAQRLVDGFDGQTAEADFTGDVSDVQNASAQAQRLVDTIDGQKATANFNGDPTDVRLAAVAALRAIAGVPDNHATDFNGDPTDIQAAAAQAQRATTGVPNNHTTDFKGDAAGTTAAAAQARKATRAVPRKKETKFDADSRPLINAISVTMARLRAIPRLVSIAFVLKNDPHTALRQIWQMLRRIEAPTKVNINTSSVQRATRDMNVFQRAAIASGNAVGRFNNLMGGDGSMARRMGRWAAAVMGAGQSLRVLGNAAQSTFPGLSRVNREASRSPGIFSRLTSPLRTAATNLRLLGTGAQIVVPNVNRMNTESSRSPGILSRVASGARTAATGVTMFGAGLAAAVLTMAGFAATASQVAATAANLVGRFSSLSGVVSTFVSVLLGVVSAVVTVAAIVGVLTLAITALAAVFASIVAVVTVATAAVGAIAIGFGLAGAAALKLAKDYGTVKAATQRVEDAHIALVAARKSGDKLRIEEAEKEYARALNASAVATKKAAGGSEAYASALKDLDNALSDVGKSFNKAFEDASTELAQMTTKVLEMANQAMPMLGQAAEETLRRIQVGFQQSHQSSTDFSDILDQIPGIFEDMSATAGNFGSFFMSFMQAVMPTVKEFTEWCQDISEKLASWADSQEGRDQIREFLDAVVPIAKAFWDMLVKVGGELLALAQEHGPQAAQMIDDFTAAASAAIEMASAWADEIMAIVSALMKAVEWVGNLIAALGNVPSGGGGAATGAMLTQAHGGDVMPFAEGGDAHFVNGPTMMGIGNKTALFGEALSGDNREYAFPMDGGWRFITEEPGFDAKSFALWADLGERKGFFGSSRPRPNEHHEPSGHGHGGGPGNFNRNIGPGGWDRHVPDSHSHDLSRVPGGAHSGSSGHGPSTGGADNPGSGVGHGSNQADSGSARVSKTVKDVGNTLEDTLEDIKRELHELPNRIKAAIDHNLTFNKDSVTSVLKGLSRESQKAVFEGDL